MQAGGLGVACRATWVRAALATTAPTRAAWLRAAPGGAVLGAATLVTSALLWSAALAGCGEEPRAARGTGAGANAAEPNAADPNTVAGSAQGATAASGPSAAANDPDTVARRLDLHLRENTTLTHIAVTLGGQVDLRATLAMQDDVLGRRTLLVLERVQALVWKVEGREVEDGLARLEGAQALVTWDERGVATTVQVPERTRAEVARLLRTIALSMQAPTADASGSVLDVPLGRARVRAAGSPGRGEARWAGADYVRVAGAHRDGVVQGEATQRYVRRDGLLLEAHYRETLRVSGPANDELAADLALDISTRDEPGRVAAWPREGLVGAAQVASSAAGRALEGRAQGLTFEQLLADVVAHEDSGRLPEHERWLWRASGRLLLEPTRASELAQACVDGRLTGPGRALAIDLLANVGHAQAQAALRAVLGNEQVAAGADYPTLLQHAVLIEAPNAATLAFFDGRVSALTGTARRVALVVLGALLDRARQAGDAPSEAQLETLRRALGSARDPQDQRAAVVALSNARAVASEPAVLVLAASPNAEVRATALRALGSLGGSAQARQLLLARALEDSHGGARTEALGALARLGPSAEELHQLATATRAGRIARADLSVLANFARRCASAPGPREVPREALMALVEALLANPALPAELGHALTELHAAPE